MHSKILGAVLAAGVLAAAASAEASQSFYFDYSGSGYDGSGTIVTGDVGSPFAITNITGTAQGSAITGLSGYAGATNQLYFPGPPFFDFGGMSFSTASAGDFNLFYNGSSFVISSLVDSGGFASSGQPIELSVSSAPEPAAWSMMLLGFGGLGVMVRRRKAEAAA